MIATVIGILIIVGLVIFSLMEFTRADRDEDAPTNHLTLTERVALKARKEERNALKARKKELETLEAYEREKYIRIVLEELAKNEYKECEPQTGTQETKQQI